jgi:dihydroorotase-like cyclic amidohydrolase
MPTIRQRTRNGKVITTTTWVAGELKIELEATEELEKVIPDIEESYTNPRDFKKALKRFLELSDERNYEDVTLTIRPKDTDAYPTFRITLSDTGEIRVHFSEEEKEPEYESIAKAVELLDEAKNTLLHIQRG